MLISTETDFDLSNKPPHGGFQYLRHPESFRACLVQVIPVSHWLTIASVLTRTLSVTCM